MRLKFKGPSGDPAKDENFVCYDGTVQGGSSTRWATPKGEYVPTGFAALMHASMGSGDKIKKCRLPK